MRLWLIEIREHAGLTMKQIASNSNISESHYCLIENGHRKPSVPTAKKIADALDFEWTLFFKERCDTSEEVMPWANKNM